MTEPWPSVNRLAAPLVEDLIGRAGELRLSVERKGTGYTLVDAGIDCSGGIEAGLRIARITMAALGEVWLDRSGAIGRWPRQVAVRSSNPVLACLGSQYAGWSLAHEDGDGSYNALGSGPGRALAAKEPLFEELGYKDQAETAVLVLEVDKVPPQALIDKILTDCGVGADGLTIILTPTQSLAGTTQIVARVLEVALHKVHELGFPLERVIEGMGSAPLPPLAPNFLSAMGRTNDAIIFGGAVQLMVSGPDEAARALAEELPSGTSRDYGKPFAEVFEAFKGDFYAIDPMLFSPAQVTVTALESGTSYRAGALDEDLLDRSFG